MLVFNHTCIGSAHLQSGTPCQDASYSETNDHLSIAIVSDGHGGRSHPRSAMGAQFAVEAAKIVIHKKLKGWNNLEKQKFYFTLIWVLWKKMVLEHFQNNPLTISEQDMLSTHFPALNSVISQEIIIEDTDIYPLYGCTLLAACIHSNGWFAFQIGDGRCVIINPNREQLTKEPIPADDRCFLNKTMSLCEANADCDFRYYGGDKDSIPDAIFLGTDGIDNSWGSENALHNFYMDILKYCSSQDIVMKELEKTLPKLSELGSHDDMSIAAIVNQSTLSKTLINIYQFQIEQCETLIQQQNDLLEKYKQDIQCLQLKLNEMPEDEFLQRDMDNIQTCLARHQLISERTICRFERLQKEFAFLRLNKK